MLISEIFYSIQGEGELAGVPSVFIRTAGCNLRCVWCDTPYASWEPVGREMEIGLITDEVRRHAASHVVVTGGEPMLARDIGRLLDALRGNGWHITIETAGTIPPIDEMPCDLASISPKLSNSTPPPGAIEPGWIMRHERDRLQPVVIANWIKCHPYQLKFVASSPAQTGEIEALVAALEVSLNERIPPSKILLMPEGIDSAALRERSAWLVEVCKQKGWRFCPRLHIELFGNKRGT